MTNFLPEGYKVPESQNNYMRFKDGLNRFRVLSNAIVGYEYFNTDNKPVRSKTMFESTPGIKETGKVKQFWAFVVWNYGENKVQILEITQKTIMLGIQSLVENEKWGDPKQYDIAITRSGEGFDTEYSVQGEPPIAPTTPEILEKYSTVPVNLEALFTNSNPFAENKNVSNEEYHNPSPSNDIPFN